MPTVESIQEPAQPTRPLQPPAQRRVEPLSADRYGVHFTADTEFRDLLERVRALASHRLPDGDLKTVLQRGLEAYERELLVSRFKVGKRPRASKRADAGPSPSSPIEARAAQRSAERVRQRESPNRAPKAPRVHLCAPARAKPHPTTVRPLAITHSRRHTRLHAVHGVHRR